MPTLEIVPDQLTKRLGMEDIREYVLYCLTEAPAPSWLKISHRAALQKLVLVYAQGLDLTYFGYPESRANIKAITLLNDMDEQALARKTLKFFNSQFSHCVVSKSSGTRGKVHNPMTNLLQCPVSHSQKEKRDKERASSEYSLLKMYLYCL
jgi:RNA exonuclease 1